MTSRRDALRGLGALTAQLAMAPGSVWALATARTREPDPLLVRLCDLVIPATDTPGAVGAGVPAFVEVALEHGIRDSSAELFAEFSRALDRRAGTDFASLPADRAHAQLDEIDRAAFARVDKTSATDVDDAVRHWPTLKALIVAGYFTSEVGAAQELRYELVPGTFEPDVPLDANPRAFSSDWTGVKFG